MLKKKFNLILIMLLVASSLSGCSSTPNNGNPIKEPSVNNEKPVVDAIPITDSINNLVEKNVAPTEFIDFANANITTATPEEATLMVQAVVNAQKSYIQQLITDQVYIKANENPQFSDVYSLDITPDLVEQITDEPIRIAVIDTYANGLKLVKSEGQVYPIIDIEFHQNHWFSYLSDSDRTTLEKDIITFNENL
ncbi:MAG: hypothetical protein RR324_06170 [Cellulosilyticaceae bacterium]